MLLSVTHVDSQGYPSSHHPELVEGRYAAPLDKLGVMQFGTHIDNRGVMQFGTHIDNLGGDASGKTVGAPCNREPAKTSLVIHYSEVPMLTPLAFALSIMSGVLGLAYLSYGWKQKHIAATTAGIVLSIMPLVTSHAVILALVGSLFVALPWLIRY